MASDENYLPAFPGISGAFRKGRSVLDGYTRGWGLQFGDLKRAIAADPLYRDSLQLAAGRTIQADECRMNLFLILKYYLPRIPAGDIVEFGAYRGGSIIFMASVCARLGRQTRAYGFDSFTGMPMTDRSIDAHNVGDFQDVDIDELRAYTQAVGLSNLEFIKGPFEATAGEYLPKIGTIALAHIDCDIRSSVAYAYEAVRHRMVPGGYVVFDDALASSCLGATEAVRIW